ncbi:MAG: hypothetical protein ABI830_04195 [Pseudolabrys sp.]
MKRANIISLFVLIVGVPAATAGSFFASGDKAANEKPCFNTGATGYQLSTAKTATADTTVRIDNAAANPSLRLQIVDDPAAADFVLVDDGDTGDACGAGSIVNVHIDPAADHPDLTVVLSRAPADTKIYVRSAHYSEQDAAALFAVIWKNARKSVTASR